VKVKRNSVRLLHFAAALPIHLVLAT
jgi:hypothetical protein